MDQLVVLIVILLIGAWFSWRDISNGRGWMCRFLSAETLQSLNSDGGQVKKALLSVVVGYATICVTIVKWLLLLKGGWKNVFNDVDSGFCDRMHLSADRLSDHCCGCIHGSGGVSDPCRDPMRSGISCNECMDDLQLIWRKDQWDIIIRL